MPADPPRDDRRHDLDALRAFAMLLGIVLHAALSFMDIPWVVQDHARAPEFGIILSTIHGFRMPLFFLLSGFFTAMLWRKRGLGATLVHRALRIALPLAIGSVTIVPLMWVLVIWAGISQGSRVAPEPPPGRDIWAAAASGDVAALRVHVEQGVSLDGRGPRYGQSPLGWAVMFDRREAVEYLLDAGADPSARYADGSTALHTAAFLGRAEAAARLLEAGAAIDVRNAYGETPLDSMRHDAGTTGYIAGLLRVPIDFDAVAAGRDRIRSRLEERGASSGLASRGLLAGLLQALTTFPLFHHLWFLWFLCWLVAGFALVVAALRLLPRFSPPTALVATPLCLLWLVPLTMLTQSFMFMPGLGPDISAGLVPMPHVLAHYAIFFGFGAVVHGVPGAADRLGRGWRIHLPVALLLLVASTALAAQASWTRALALDEEARRFLLDLGEVLYAWLMIFGLMGVFERVFGRKRPRVRYVSDSSYWLYLVHLPPIVVGQLLLRDVELPALVKLALLLTIVVAILLTSYQLLVRYTWIGWLLNGRRTRPADASSDL